MENIFDFINLYSLYPIYAGMLFSLLLKFLWVWAIDHNHIESFPSKLDFTLTLTDMQIQKKSRLAPNPLLVWIIKFIRNKSGFNDDLAPFISLSI